MQGANRPADLLQDNKLFAVLQIREQFDDATDMTQLEDHLFCLTIS